MVTCRVVVAEAGDEGAAEEEEGERTMPGLWRRQQLLPPPLLLLPRVRRVEVAPTTLSCPAGAKMPARRLRQKRTAK